MPDHEITVRPERIAKLRELRARIKFVRDEATSYPGAPSEDSEERDRVLFYAEEVMDILEIESSGGLLSRWRYGFDPG